MSSAPYSGMSITWFVGAQTRTGFVTAGASGTSGTFHVVVDGNSGTAEQIYEFVQYELRQVSDIDAGAGVRTGSVADSLLRFVGDTLYTLPQTVGGVCVDNFLASDTNRVVFADDGATNRTFPYVATLTLQFGDNLVFDSGSIYHVYFTNDDSGDNTGRDFGTADAITTNDKLGVAMSGSVSGSASIQRSFDYDGNSQRGTGSIATDAPITVVSIGLNTAQYVKAIGTIQRSTANVVSLVAPLERNYQNT